MPDAPSHLPQSSALSPSLSQPASSRTAADLFVSVEPASASPRAPLDRPAEIASGAPEAGPAALARRMSPMARSLLLGAGALRLKGRAPAVVLEVEMTWCVLQRGVRPGNIPALVTSEQRRRLCGALAAFVVYAALLFSGLAAIVAATSGAGVLLGLGLLAAQAVLGVQVRQGADRLRLSVLECSLADMQSLRSQLAAARRAPPA